MVAAWKRRFTEAGLTEWSVHNLEEIRWRRLPGLGTGTRPVQDEWWEQIGIALRYLGPGETFAHAVVGGPCVVLAVGARRHEIKAGTGWGEYPVDEAALRYGVGVEQATDDPDVAYARFSGTETLSYGGWLRA